MRKRYRYILCGLCSPDDPISDFRLIASNNLSLSIGRGIRVTVDDIELEKCRCDSYSTTCSEIPIKNLNPTVFGYNKKINEKLTKMWLNNKIQPHEFWEYAIKLTKVN